MSIAWDIVEPYLVRAGLYSIPDPTYGRYLIPPHTPHLDLINHPDVKHQYRRVFLRPYQSFETLQEAYESPEIVYAEDVDLEAHELKPGRWVCYSIWEHKSPTGKGVGNDLVLVHGLSDYGLRYAPHVLYHLQAGFRVIIPDLPSYGRSTGVHSYLPSLELLPAALHAVLTDAAALNQRRRKVFLSGASLGGWTVLYYLLKFPHSPISGAFVMCPAVEVSPESRPHALIELIGRGIQYVAGTLPLARALRGKVSHDPRVEADFFSDKLTYHGWLRVATGFSLLQGMTELDRRAEEINVPIRLIHGDVDRVTSFRGTERFSQRLTNPDTQFEAYKGYEHDEADDEDRQRVLRDWQQWLTERC